MTPVSPVTPEALYRGMRLIRAFEETALSLSLIHI